MTDWSYTDAWRPSHGATDSDGAAKRDHVDALTAAETLLRDEFGQAWQHFRHLEAMRGQYLAFAFTITLASFAAAIPLVANIIGGAAEAICVGSIISPPPGGTWHSS